jgi:type I restriction enzyme, S subunit
MNSDATQVRVGARSHAAHAQAEDVPPGYKRTEVGVLPEDWQSKRLGEIGKVVRGGSPRPAGDPRFFNGAFIPWLTVAALTSLPDHATHVLETFSHLTEEGARRSRTLDPGTLIIANSGATLGVAKILDLKCCANDGIAALINQQSGNKSFLCHYINTQTGRLRDVVATGNGQPNLNTSLIAEIPVPFPQPAEQRAIAEALSDVDGLLGALEALIAKKRAIKQAAMQQLLTGKTRLPGFSGEWETKRLVEIGHFLKGSGVKRDDARSGALACVRYGEIYTVHDDYVRTFNSWISAEVAATATRLEYGDLLFAGSGETKEEIGKCVAIVTECEAYAGGDIVILRPRDVDPLFFGYALNTPRVAKQRASLGQGDAVVHISAAALAQVSLAVPSIEEQTAIASVLSDMDAEIAALEARRDKTRAIKQGMMQQLLTGRVRLVKPEAAA